MPANVTEDVLGVIAQAQRIPIEKVTLESRFEDLGIDSMDAVNILFALEEKFDIAIPDEAAKEIRGIREMVEGVQKLVDAKPDPRATGEREQAAL
jgi:acyl carrier protein